MYCLEVLGARREKERQQWFVLKAVWEGAVPRPSPWLRDGRLLPVSVHIVSLCAYLSLWAYLSLCAYPLIFKDTSHTGLGPTLMTSF